jgi:hypothetical protein
VLAIAVMGAFGLASVAVGCYDGFVAGLSGPDRLSALALLVAGLTMCAGAIAVVHLMLRPAHQRAQLARTVALLGAIAAFLASVFLLASTLRTSGATAVPQGLLTLAAFGSGACIWFFRSGTQLTAVRIGSTFLAVLGTLAGLAQYAYSNDIASSSLTHTFQLEAHLARAGTSGGLEVVRATIVVTNSGGSPAVSVGSAYTFTGEQAFPCSRPATLRAVTSYFDFSVPDPQALRYSRYVALMPARVLAAGKVLGDGARLDSGQVVTRSYLFYVPPNTFQVLALRAQVFAIPSGAIALGTHQGDFESVPAAGARQWQPNRDGDVYVFWRVRDHSLLRTLLAGPDQWLVVRYELSRAPTLPTHTNPAIRATARLTPRGWSSAHPDPAAAAQLFPTLSAVASASEPFGDDELADAPLPRTTPASIARSHGCEQPTPP